jgi:AcrR family transcriptional regulator
MIADAVRRVGSREALTMRAVADELGVDVTTLYRHVGGIDALRQIGANLSAPTVREWPSPGGETWRSWLVALARYYRNALRENPDLLDFAQTALDPDFHRVEHATRILVDFGFEARTAGFAHALVMNHVVGFVHQERRDREKLARGQSAAVRFVQALESDRESDGLATLRSLELAPRDFDPDVAFERLLAVVIDGIGVQPGAPRTPVRRGAQRPGADAARRGARRRTSQASRR